MRKFLKKLLEYIVKPVVIVNNKYDKLHDRAKFRFSLLVIAAFTLLHISGAALDHPGFNSIGWGILFGFVFQRLWWLEYASKIDKYYLYLVKN